MKTNGQSKVCKYAFLFCRRILFFWFVTLSHLSFSSSTFTVRSEKFNPKTLRTFRQVARAVSGESLEPAVTDIVLFGRTSSRSKTGIIY